MCGWETAKQTKKQQAEVQTHLKKTMVSQKSDACVFPKHRVLQAIWLYIEVSFQGYLIDVTVVSTIGSIFVNNDPSMERMNSTLRVLNIPFASF